jgi:hypothetical protein
MKHILYGIYQQKGYNSRAQMVENQIRDWKYQEVKYFRYAQYSR